MSRQHAVYDDHRQSIPLRLLVCLATVLVGCASSGRDTTPISTEANPRVTISSASGAVVPTAATTTPITIAATNTLDLDPGDQRPVLTMGFWTYGPTDYWRPRDLADVYVYPDGTVVRVVLDGIADGSTRSLQFETFTIGGDELLALSNLADAASLSGGALQPIVPLPAGVQIVDGGATMFTARHGNQVTARAVDQLSSDNTHTDDAREPFAKLSAALVPLCCRARTDMTTSPVTRWVIVSTPGNGETAYPQQNWTSPDLTSLNWVNVGDDTKCAIVDQTDWTLTTNERHVPAIVLDGRIITRRPLLPHEHTCDDIAAFRQSLGL